MITIPFFDNHLLESTLNHALQLDPDAKTKLSVLEGKSIAITLDNYSQPWIFLVSNGTFLTTEREIEDCDVRLSGTISSFLRLFRQREQSAFATTDKLYIAGDLHSAQQFQRVMASLTPDFDAALNNRFGEHLGGGLSRILHALRQHGEQAKASIDAQLHTLLSGEQGQCATREEMYAFQQRMTQLRLTLDRLDARLNQLES